MKIIKTYLSVELIVFIIYVIINILANSELRLKYQLLMIYLLMIYFLLAYLRFILFSLFEENKLNEEEKNGN